MAAKRRYFVEKDSDYYWIERQDGLFLNRFSREANDKFPCSYYANELENFTSVKEITEAEFVLMF